MMTTDPDTTGRRIRKYRARKALTQEALAHLAGVSYRTLCGLERDELDGTRISTLRAVAAALEVPVTALIPDVVTK